MHDSYPNPREMGEINRRRIWNYFHTDPFRTIAECAGDLGLHANTVRRHTRDIKRGWKPEQVEDVQ